MEKFCWLTCSICWQIYWQSAIINTTIFIPEHWNWKGKLEDMYERKFCAISFFSICPNNRYTARVSKFKSSWSVKLVKYLDLWSLIPDGWHKAGCCKGKEGSHRDGQLLELRTEAECPSMSFAQFLYEFLSVFYICTFNFEQAKLYCVLFTQAWVNQKPENTRKKHNFENLIFQGWGAGKCYSSSSSCYLFFF